MFWRKSNITSDEYADFSAKIVKLSSEMLILKAEMEKTEESRRWQWLCVARHQRQKLESGQRCSKKRRAKGSGPKSAAYADCR